MGTEKRLKFTKKAIEALPVPASGRVEYNDTDLPGLRLRVSFTGSRIFSWMGHRMGKVYRAPIGRYPAITVEQARAMALELLNGATTAPEVNPNDARKAQRMAGVTLREALDEYLRSRGHRIKPATVMQYTRMLENFSGDWMDQPLANVSRDRVEARHKAITEGRAWFGANKSSRKAGTGSGSQAQADLWGRCLRAVYRFAHDHFRDVNGETILPDVPTRVLSTKRQWHGTTRKTERIRNHELGRWLRAVEQVRQYSASCRDDMAVSVCDALDVALFTGLRRSEIFELTWDRVNIGARYFWISTTKNGDALELPMTDSLLAIFRRRQAVRAASPLVFPSANGGVVSDPRRVIDLISAATVPDDNPDGLQPIHFKCHDARRTFGSVAELASVGTYTIKRLMNHRTGRSADVTVGYLSFSADELRKPAQVIERAILEHAGLTDPAGGVDAKLSLVLDRLSDREKHELLIRLYASTSEAAVNE